MKRAAAQELEALVDLAHYRRVPQRVDVHEDGLDMLTGALIYAQVGDGSGQLVRDEAEGVVGVVDGAVLVEVCGVAGVVGLGRDGAFLRVPLPQVVHGRDAE